MVKMSEAVICQRFVQNTWKKDLCSNCFKSKEDHVLIPEKKIAYKWTSHVDNFPQHSILRRNKKSEEPAKTKAQTVSFQTTKTEIIGFGGEEYSSDDEPFVSYSEDVTETDNEEEDEEFRKLTQSNTDFNSVPANLRNDKLVVVANVKGDTLKLGKALTDASGQEQILRVAVEPFENSIITVGGLPNERKIHLNTILLEGGKKEEQKEKEKEKEKEKDKESVEKKTDKETTGSYRDLNNLDLGKDNCGTRISRPANVTSVNVNETINEDNIYLKCNDGIGIEENECLKITNVLVNVSNIEYKQNQKIESAETANNTQNRPLVEPLFKLGTYDQTMEECCNGSSVATLPSIKSKELEIEIDKPGSREMVGEPDGRADSDDSAEPLPMPVPDTKNQMDSTHANRQRSFLHGFIKDKPTFAAKSCEQISSHEYSQNVGIELTIANSIPSTPKMSMSSFANCLSGSTKRQAPKPPSPKIHSQIPEITQTANVTLTSKKYDDAAALNNIRLMEHSNVTESKISVKRKLNLKSVNHRSPNRGSLNMSLINANLIESKPNCLSDVNDENENDSVFSVVSGGVRTSTKCSRSLSCDSIVSPGVAVFSEKSRKYSGATIKVKSTLKKFLRLNSKDDGKIENDTNVPSVPRRRIEIIHPLDLNKSSIEILRPAVDENQKTDTEEVKSTPPSTARPTKPPPPPRNQSLDQKIVSEISKPVRPPPPKSINTKSTAKFESIYKGSSNVYENLGESRHGIAPAKPQRASSMRDRARPSSKNGDNACCLSDREAVPECDQQTEICETRATSSITYCGSETESELYQSAASSNSDMVQTEFDDASEERRKNNKLIVHSSFEDNYDAVVDANHETLSRLLEQVLQIALIPNALKILQTTLHIRFEHFVIIENSRITASDWNFYNAKWSGHDVVVSISNKPLGPTKSLPAYVTLSPLVKFTDVIPGRYVKNDSSAEEMNAYITVWNEQKIESVITYAKKLETLENCVREGGLLIAQLTNALCHLQACSIEDVSLDEMFICKRETDVESKLLILPIKIDYLAAAAGEQSTGRISLCKCIPVVLNIFSFKSSLNDVFKRLLSDEKATSLSQAKTVAEYWLWGPYDVTIVKNNDRHATLQRWLDLERATFLYRVICKKPADFSLNERCHLVFLVQTNAKLLAEASFLLEKKVICLN